MTQSPAWLQDASKPRGRQYRKFASYDLAKAAADRALAKAQASGAI